MLLRKEKYPNDFPDKTGQHEIIVRRFAGTYSLKFIRYGLTYTYIRLYIIKPYQFTELVAYFGKMIRHSRIHSQYLMASDRKHVDLWMAQHKGTTNYMIVYPNQSAAYTTRLSYEKMKSRRIKSESDTFVQFDPYGNAWTVKYMRVKW